MYKQNNKIFSNFKIPQFQSPLLITEHVREVQLGEYQEKNWYLWFDEIRDSRLKKDSTSSLQRKKLNVLHPKEMNLTKPITEKI